MIDLILAMNLTAAQPKPTPTPTPPAKKEQVKPTNPTPQPNTTPPEEGSKNDLKNTILQRIRGKANGK